MRYQTSTFRIKLIYGAILCITIAILLLVWNEANADLGNFIDPESVEFYTDSNNRIRIEFYVDTTFEVNYYNQYPPTPELCETLDYGWGYLPFSFHSDNIYPSPIHAGFFTQSLEIVDAPTCEEASETYTAGNTYAVYLFRPFGITLFELGGDMLSAIVKDSPTCQNSISCPYDTSDTGYLEIQQVEYPLTTWNWQEKPNITINYPADEGEVDSEFIMLIDYALLGEYNRLMIIFEEWDASTTCPLYGTEEWEIEQALGYFDYQSLPFFSPILTATTSSTTIGVNDLNSGVYNCVRCFYINEETGQMSDELCAEYNISVSTYISPSYVPRFYLPIDSWSSYYALHSERFATSTPLFEDWAGTFEPLISWVGNTVIFFQDYFDVDEAKLKGEEMGNSIATARGYLESIDDFFGGLPISSVFIFYLITALVIIVYRIVKGILTIIVP